MTRHRELTRTLPNMRLNNIFSSQILYRCKWQRSIIQIPRLRRSLKSRHPKLTSRLHRQSRAKWVTITSLKVKSQILLIANSWKHNNHNKMLLFSIQSRSCQGIESRLDNKTWEKTVPTKREAPCCRSSNLNLIETRFNSKRHLSQFRATRALKRHNHRLRSKNLRRRTCSRHSSHLNAGLPPAIPCSTLWIPKQGARRFPATIYTDMLVSLREKSKQSLTHRVTKVVMESCTVAT